MGYKLRLYFFFFFYKNHNTPTNITKIKFKKIFLIGTNWRDTVECREMGDKTLQGDTTTVEGVRQKRPVSMMRTILILLSLVGLIGASSYVYVRRDDLMSLQPRTKRSVVEMTHENKVNETNQPVVSEPAATNLEDRPVANSVLRHHAVKQEVNTHINLQDFMKAAAEKVKLRTTDEDDDNDNQDIVESELVQVEKLPDFDVCPIMPELPGEFGTIRKVREIERKNVSERVKGLI